MGRLSDEFRFLAIRFFWISTFLGQEHAQERWELSELDQHRWIFRTSPITVIGSLKRLKESGCRGFEGSQLLERRFTDLEGDD